MIFLNLFLEKIYEDFGMKCPQVQMKNLIKTQYAFNKKVREVRNEIVRMEKRQQL